MVLVSGVDAAVEGVAGDDEAGGGSVADGDCGVLFCIDDVVDASALTSFAESSRSLGGRRLADGGILSVKISSYAMS